MENQEKGENNSLKNVIIKMFVDSLIFDYTRDLIIFNGTLKILLPAGSNILITRTISSTTSILFSEFHF